MNARNETKYEMKTKTIKISPEVLEVLNRMTFDGTSARLPDEQLARDLYVKVNKVLETAGGKWNRSKRAHVFDKDPRGALGLAVETGEIVDKKATFQFFETPPALADQLVATLDPSPGDMILEPSAGHGALVKALIRAGAEQGWICANEIDPEKSGVLVELLGASRVTCGDFLHLSKANEFDRIVANPPFCGGQDIAHLRKAYDCLKIGGRLVFVTSPGWLTKHDMASREFREWLSGSEEELRFEHDEPIEVHGAWKQTTVERLPSGSFKESGTMVEALVVVIDKRND